MDAKTGTVTINGGGNNGEAPLVRPLAEVLALVAPERLVPRQAGNACCLVEENLWEPQAEGPSTQLHGYLPTDRPHKSPPRLFAVLRLVRVCRACGCRHRFFIDQEIPE